MNNKQKTNEYADTGYHAGNQNAPKGNMLKELVKASGKIDFPLTNDAIFHMVLNRNSKALKGFVSSLLHMPLDTIKSIVITNPELFGYSVNVKQYRLDINILLNDDTIIDIEMQVIWNRYWKNRALVYICRDLDNIRKGGEYSELKQAIQIGIVNGIPKDKSSGFYSKYMLADVDTNEIYSDRLIIYMMDLGKINEATKEDAEWGLSNWAKLLTASTWEEAKMAAMDNEYVTEAANTMFILNSDYQARKRALEREDFIQHEKYIDEVLKRQKAALDEKDKEAEQNRKLLAEKDKEAEQNRKLLAEKDKEAECNRKLLAKKDKEAEQNRKLLAEKDKEAEQNRKLLDEKDKEAEQNRKLLAEKDKEAECNRKLLAKKDKEAEQNRKLLAEKDKAIAETKEALAEKDAEIAELKAKLAAKN